MLVLLACGARASAQAIQKPLAQAITLSPNATCLERTAIEAQVEAWLGSAEIPADIRVSIQGDATDARAVSFHIERAGSVRERHFDRLPPHCADATAIVGLAIALAIDASLLEDWIVPAAEKKAPPPIAPAKTERTSLSLQLAAAHAVIPGTAGGFRVGLGYAPVPWLSAHLQALTLFSFNNRVAGSRGVFDATAVAALPVLCAGGAASERVRVDLCSGAALGVLQVRGRNFVHSQSARAFWSVAVAGMRVVLEARAHSSLARPRARFGWVLDLQAVLPLRVPPIAARDQGNLARERRPESVGGMASFGPQFLF